MGETVLVAPVSGRLVALAEVPDPVFSQGMLGPGFAVEPFGGVVVAPVSGVVSCAAATGHAFGLTADDGTELIVHVGIDTVEMAGVGFSPLVAQGQRVRAGQPFVRFSRERVRAAGHSDLVVVVLTSRSGEDARLLDPVEGADVFVGEPVRLAAAH